MPLPYHGVDEYVEQLRQQGTTLCNAAARLKGDPIIARGMADVRGLIPEVPNESPHVWPNPVLFQQLKASFPIHCIKSLCEVDKHPVKQRLFDVCELLSQLRLDQGRAVPRRLRQP